MKPTIKLAFSDFWEGFNPEQNLLTNLLRRQFNVQLDDSDPDLLIYSCYGFDFMKYKCHRIFYTAENVRPDFKECDYSLSFDYDDYNGRNLRIPLYLFTFLKYLVKGNELPIAKTPKTKFCNMVVSNPSGRERNAFFEALNQYKRVDSGGKYKNNVGGPVGDKLEFIANYRFTIAFENSSYPGYTTEKLVQPMLVGSIPIYWGNPRIAEEFNSKSFINVHEFGSFEDVIEEIARVEENSSAYEEMINQPWLIENNAGPGQDYDLLSDKLRDIVDRILNQSPVANYSMFYSRRKKIKRKVINKITKKPIWYI